MSGAHERGLGKGKAVLVAVPGAFPCCHGAIARLIRGRRAVMRSDVSRNSTSKRPAVSESVHGIGVARLNQWPQIQRVFAVAYAADAGYGLAQAVRVGDVNLGQTASPSTGHRPSANDRARRSLRALVKAEMYARDGQLVRRDAVRYDMEGGTRRGRVRREVYGGVFALRARSSVCTARRCRSARRDQMHGPTLTREELQEFLAFPAAHAQAGYHTPPEGVRFLFEAGLPDPTTFPIDDLVRLSEQVLRHEFTEALQYGGAGDDGIGAGSRWRRDSRKDAKSDGRADRRRDATCGRRKGWRGCSKLWSTWRCVAIEDLSGTRYWQGRTPRRRNDALQRCRRSESRVLEQNLERLAPRGANKVRVHNPTFNTPTGCDSRSSDGDES